MEKPAGFNNPFDYEPHPLCLLAADEVTCFVESQPELLADARRGKMFGVLIVERDGQLGFLAAYSGLLAGRNDWAYFVPSVFDAQQPDGHFKTEERCISAINAELAALASSSTPSAPSSVPSSLAPSSYATPVAQPTVLALKAERKRRSEALQLWLFRQYRMLNARGEEKDLVEIWRDYHTSPKLQQRYPLPPGGSGDCCAPKLLQYAYRQGLRPVTMAEFWYGESPRGEIRHHGQFYPACRGKCLPILTFMMQGLVREDVTHAGWERPMLSVRTIYADDNLLVVEKPSGLLSVPGRIEAPSLQQLLTEQYGDVFMPHRLDMDTSGLMVVARNEATYKNLQQQFYARNIYKRYEALLSASLSPSLPAKGTITLPLRPDPLDRPRQVVDVLHGKQAVTDYEVLSSCTSPIDPHVVLPLLSLTPHTGRTHQLRVHCAHPDGLGTPILGDALYGQKAHRLCLHAAELAFTHPVTGERMHFASPAHFHC